MNAHEEELREGIRLIKIIENDSPEPYVLVATEFAKNLFLQLLHDVRFSPDQKHEIRSFMIKYNL